MDWKKDLLKESTQTLNNLQKEENSAKPDITDRAAEEIERSMVIFDSIFGIGINRPIVGFLVKVLATVNKKKRKDSLCLGSSMNA